VDFRKWLIGEGLLWLGFVGLAVLSLDHGPENGVAITGLFALAAIGVRATRPLAIAKPSTADGE
jgi:hypothetical protein